MLTEIEAKQIVEDLMFGRKLPDVEWEIVEHNPDSKSMRIKLNGEPYKVWLEVGDVTDGACAFEFKFKSEKKHKGPT